MRRSSRIRAKKRVNYNEDAMFYKAIGKTKSAWNQLVEVAADDPPPAQKPWQKRALFRPKPPASLRSARRMPGSPALVGQPPPKKKPGRLTRKKASAPSAIERDEKEVDFDLAEMEGAQARVDRIEGPVAVPERRETLSKRRKHLLFMNPGDKPIEAAMTALARGAPLPAWARPFARELGLRNGRLLWSEPGGPGALRFALKAEKRAAVKRLYFDPREPATILPITLRLYEQWANVSRRNVRHILQSLETYQLNRGRRRPPDLKNRMFMKGPGMLAMDMFFPSVNLGWEKTNVLCCMDTWSRYCGVYVLDTKRYADVFKGMKDFLAKFASFGHMPRRILSDKGSDMAAAPRAIEPYRQARDGQRPMVLHTATGTPVLIIEGLNAQVQRRMQVFRTSDLIDSAGQIAHEIADQINHQGRPDRGGLTPIQLLQLDAEGRNAINLLYRDRTVTAEVPGLAPLYVNDTVRLLKMTRKEQETNKIKGFAPKWSKRLYTVLRKTKLRKNEFVFRYDVGLPDTYYRHELQKVRGGRVDTHVPRDYVRYKEVVIGGYDPADEGFGDEEWEHE